MIVYDGILSGTAARVVRSKRQKSSKAVGTAPLLRVRGGVVVILWEGCWDFSGTKSRSLYLDL